MGKQLESMREVESKNQQQLKKSRDCNIELEEQLQSLQATINLDATRIKLLEEDVQEKKEQIQSEQEANRKLVASSQQVILSEALNVVGKNDPGERGIDWNP